MKDISRRKHSREQTIRIERKGIQRKLWVRKKKGNGQKKRKIILQIFRSLKLIECTPAGQSIPVAHGLKKLYKESK